MAKSHSFDSGMRILMTLQYLHNLTESYGENALTIVKVKQLAEYLTSECGMPTSRDTAKKILDAIYESDTGYHIERQISEGGQTLYKYRRTFTLEQISLLSTIICSSMFLGEYEIEKLLGQLRNLTSEENAKSLPCLESFLRPRMINAEALGNLRIIYEAINNKKTLSFYLGSMDAEKNIYYDKSKKENDPEFKRVIFNYKTNERKEKNLKKTSSYQGKPIICSPYSLVWDNSRCYLICSVLHDNNNYLWNYRVDRLFELKISDELYNKGKWSPFYDFKKGNLDAEEYLHSIFKMFPSRAPLIKVALKFKDRLVRVIVEKFGFETEIKRINEEYMMAEVKVQVSKQFYGWLAGFESEDLSLVSPAEEVEKYKNYLKKALDYYSTNDVALK